MKKALISGITGQDGSYLAELLLKKGYLVYGLQRRSSTPNTSRIDHIYDNPEYPQFVTIYSDLSEGSNLSRIIAKVEPDEIYNLGAQSHVQISFDLPEYTSNVNGIGALRILDAIKDSKKSIKFYQASSSEMFGKVLAIPQNETTTFNPQSPYALSKVFGYYITKIYRQSFGLFAANGILFNHESPRRGITFVTRKITLGLSRIKIGQQSKLRMGNLDAKRDWGYAKDYAEAIWMILQHNKPDDFVIATGQTYTVREFIEEAGRHLDMDIVWKGKGVDEKGIDKKTGKVVVEIDPLYFRPLEVDLLIGDATKAQQILHWRPKTKFKGLVELMIKYDFDLAKQEAKIGLHKVEVQWGILKNAGKRKKWKKSITKK